MLRCIRNANLQRAERIAVIPGRPESVDPAQPALSDIAFAAVPRAGMTSGSVED
jgi:hypothetical protein